MYLKNRDLTEIWKSMIVRILYVYRCGPALKNRQSSILKYHYYIQHVFYILYKMYNVYCIIYVTHYYIGRCIDIPQYKFYPTSINHCVQSPSSYNILLLFSSLREYQWPHSFLVLNTKKIVFVFYRSKYSREVYNNISDKKNPFGTSWFTSIWRNMYIYIQL